jgi:membrane protein YqaA with SNARE-associated domain
MAFDVVGTIVLLVGGNPILVVFLVSIIGNMIPFFPVPYLLFVITIASGFPGLGLFQIAAVSALGASIGKFVSYGLGYGARRALSGSRARFDSFRKLVGGSSFLLALVFAALPLPDDIVFVPLGIIRYSPVKTFIALYSGKFFLTAVITYVARSSQGSIEDLLGGGLYVSILSALIVILVAILLMRVDWEEVLVEGRRGTIRRLLKGIFGRNASSKKQSDPSD